MELQIFYPYHASNSNKGIGRQVKKTDINRKDFLPQTSDNAPSNGAERKDNKPWEKGGEEEEEKEGAGEEEKEEEDKRIRRGRGRVNKNLHNIKK